MIYWSQLLHFYQPPTQTHPVLDKVCNESYRPLFKLMDEEPATKVTVNINGALTEILARHGMDDVISGLKNLAKKGKIEFTGSAKYHSILPLIPAEEMQRQIELNYETNSHYFGDSYAPKGFFPPEMAFESNILPAVISTGHEWILLSGVACPVEWPKSTVFRVADGEHKLSVFFRDDILSNRISFRQTDATGFMKNLLGLSENNGDIYVITAMDAETFGHHHVNWDTLFLKRILGMVNEQAKANRAVFSISGPEKPEIRMVMLSELLKLFREDNIIRPYASSWSTSRSEIESGIPYPLWEGKDNILHKLLWQHLWLAIELTEKAMYVAKGADAVKFAASARTLCDEAENSDQFWWASEKPSRNFSIIYRGLSLQTEAALNAYKAIKLSKLSENDETESRYRVIAAADYHQKILDVLYDS